MEKLTKELLKESIGKGINLYMIPEIGRGEFILTGTLTKHKGNNPLYKVTCDSNKNNYYIFSEDDIYVLDELFGDIIMVLNIKFNYTDEMRKMVAI